MKNKNYILLTLIITTLFSFSGMAKASTIGPLFPILDGGDDSLVWFDHNNSPCNLVDCYIEMDESSGSECDGSDGDDSYIRNTETEGAQTFHFDESDIPDGSTILGVNVNVCHKKDIGDAGDFQLRYCFNGGCVNSMVSVTAEDVYKKSSYFFPANETKNVLSYIEAGFVGASTTNRMRISQISAEITYSVPGEVDVFVPEKGTSSPSVDLPQDVVETATTTPEEIIEDEATTTPPEIQSMFNVTIEPETGFETDFALPTTSVREIKTILLGPPAEKPVDIAPVAEEDIFVEEAASGSLNIFSYPIDREWGGQEAVEEPSTKLELLDVFIILALLALAILLKLFWLEKK
jgi:hypothetical protein